MTLTSRVTARLAAAAALLVSMTLIPAVITPTSADESTTYQISASWPSGPVEVSTPVTVRGSLSPPGSYSVLLEGRIWSSTPFQTIDATSSDVSGGYQFLISSAFAGTISFRIRVNDPNFSDVYAERHVTFVSSDGADEIPQEPGSEHPTDTPVATEPDEPTRPADPPRPDNPPHHARGTKVSVAASARTVGLDEAVYLHGHVSGPARPISIVEQLPSGWQTVATGRTNANGRFRITAPTNWYGTHRYAVEAPATATYREARSRAHVVRVRTAYRPGGSPASWTFISGPSQRFRFDPCQTITYRVNRDGAPRGALRDVKGTFARLTRATGMRFKYLGKTAFKAYANRPGTAPDDARLTIAWSSPQASAALGGAAGIGGPLAALGGARDAQGPVYEIERSAVLLSTRFNSLATGFGAGPRSGYQGTLGQLLMHEVAHALGIGHTNDTRQIMYPMMSRKPARWGAGDLTALSKIGLAAGCLAEHSVTLAARSMSTRAVALH